MSRLVAASINMPSELKLMGYFLFVSRLLFIGGIAFFVAGILGEIWVFAMNPSFASMGQGPPEEQAVHRICLMACLCGAPAALLGGVVWLITAHWNRIVATLGPEGG